LNVTSGEYGRFFRLSFSAEEVAKVKGAGK